MRAGRIRAAVLAVGIAVPSLLGEGVAPAAGIGDRAAASSPRTVHLVDCRGDRAKIKPMSVILACGDAGAIVEKAKWQHWGAPQATATAVLSENDCTPTCYQGSFVSEPAKVTVGSIRKRHGIYEYGHIRVVPLSPNRHHFKTFSAPLPG
jgi:hypothetical protein